jgi:hypothetical protein
MDVVQLMEKVATGTNDKPRMPVMITDCGQVSDEVVDDNSDQQQQSAQATAAAKVYIVNKTYYSSNCDLLGTVRALKDAVY